MARERVFEGAAFDPAKHKAFAVRAAMRLQIIHPLQSPQIDRNTVETDYSYNATHIIF
jgi:hypothetical protein